ncbi:MAG: gliding motility protein GldN [Crocinitomicaceae bacterium]|nr:gliding motility protein GldN [Crocinitomicaceae bacterium]|tara:strand:+ start:16853 stop:17707 length:855 start_codon:yes stop_codon:yes gene_type:complete
MKKLILSLFVLVGLSMSSTDVLAQQTVLDGVYVNENTPSRKVIPYTNLRQADVMWSKRIWRRVDLRKKQNQVFYYPEEPAQGRKNLFDYIRQAILDDGTLTAYDPGTVVDPDDEFTRALTTDDVMAKMVSESEVDIFDEFGDPIGTETVRDTLLATAIKFYEIKEEWFFEKQKSQLEVRIIGIKPVVEKIGADGDPVLEDLFWIYFPEARFVFANSEVFNRVNDAERRTYEDIFWKRQFESTIIKESNVYDRMISQYKTGLDALLEAEKIEEKIFNFEHDFWHY